MTPLSRRFWRLAVPNVLANLTVPFVGLVDTAMLGHLPDPEDLAGVALGALVFDFVFWTFGFLRMSTTGLTAQARGMGDPNEAVRVGIRAIGLGVAIGLLVLLVRDPLGAVAFQILEGASNAEAAGIAYYDHRVLAAPLTLATFAINGWLLGMGRARAVLLTTAVANGLNIGLDYLFIMEWGWGAAGAGAATAIGEGAACLVGIGLVFPSFLQSTNPSKGLFDRGVWRSLWTANRDIMIRTLTLVGAFATFTDFSAVLGTALVAANAVLLRVLGAAAFLIDGMAFATETLAGEAHGRNDKAALRRVLSLSLKAGVGTGMALALAFALAPQALLPILTNQAGVLPLASQFAPWLLPVLGVGSAAYILDGYFLGVTATRHFRNAAVFSTFVGFVPIALIARATASPTLLWVAMAVFMVTRVVTLSLGVPKTLTDASSSSP